MKTKNYLSQIQAPSAALPASVLSAAGFERDDLARIEKNGFSVGVMYAHEPYFFNVQYGGIYPLSQLRDEYEDRKEDFDEDFCVTSFGGFMKKAAGEEDCELCPSSHFFVPVVNDDVMLEQAEASWGLEYIIEGAEDFAARNANSKICILSVFCPYGYQPDRDGE